MKKTLLLLTGLLLFFFNTHAQYVITKLWDKTVGGNLQEYMPSNYSGTQRCYKLPDGKILIAGSSRSYISGDKTENTWGDYDAWLVALDSSTGQITWNHDYGGLFTDYFADLTPSGNRSHLLTFFSISEDTAGGNFTVPCTYCAPNISSPGTRYLMLDSNWNVIWDRMFQGGSEPRRIIWQDGKYYLLFHGGGFISSELTDTTCIYTSNQQVAIVARDSSGSLLWDKNYGADYYLPQVPVVDDDRSTDLLPLVGGGSLMSGYTNANIPTCTIGDTSAGLYDINIYRLDSVGQVLWQRCYGGVEDERTSAKLLNTSDGDYLFMGTSLSPQGGELSQPTPATASTISLWLVKFNDSGTILWDKRFSSCHGIYNSNNQPHTIINTNDGGFLVGATIGLPSSEDSIPGCDVTEYGRGSRDFWILKLDSAGNKQWDKRWGGSKTDILKDLIQLGDDSYIATGISYSDISGDKTENNRDASLLTADYWAVRFRADLMVGLEEAWVSDMQLAVSPNPAKDICTITLSNTSTLKHSNTLTLYDITGRALLQQAFNGTVQIEVSKLARGMYIVEARDKEGRSVKGKLVKE